MGRKPAALFIGRWQPFHNGHAHIIQQALDAGDNVVIALRNTEVSDGDPYTLGERVAMIEAVYEDDDRVEVICIPDIKSVNIGRKVGYEVVRYDAPEDIEGISATAIRKALDAGDRSWVGKVPAAVAEFLLPEPPEEDGGVVWFTGLSGSGKSTIANLLREHGVVDYVLDGDVLREGICKGLGFSREDRDENIRRVAWAAKMLADTDARVVVACIGPYAAARNEAREIVGPGRFTGVHLSTSLEVCEMRDPKGLYKKVRAGEIEHFTGVDDPYETPTEHWWFEVNTGLFSAHDVMIKIVEALSVR